MLIFLKRDPDPAALEALRRWLEEEGAVVTRPAGGDGLLVVEGDDSRLDAERIAAWDLVEDVRQTRPSYRLASRAGHPENTVVTVGGVSIGDGGLTLIAGPCCVESEEQVVSVARAVKRGGAALLRGGAFKPRSSPYSFQGLGAKGLEYLKTARQETDLPIVSELMDPSLLPLFRDVDIIQVGARNMQNYELLKALARQDKPVLLKRNPAATYEELLLSAEYLLAGGNPNVILCERGIRSFEPSVRSTLDLSAVPVLHRLTHLPVLVDPSHAAGRSALVAPLSLGAVAAGCDGLLIEVHDDPARALCDGLQALRPGEFDSLAGEATALRVFLRGQES